MEGLGRRSKEVKEPEDLSENTEEKPQPSRNPLPSATSQLSQAAKMSIMGPPEESDAPPTSKSEETEQ